MLRAHRERIHNKTITLQHGCPDVRGRAGDTADRHILFLYSGVEVGGLKAQTQIVFLQLM